MDATKNTNTNHKGKGENTFTMLFDTLLPKKENVFYDLLKHTCTMLFFTLLQKLEIG